VLELEKVSQGVQQPSIIIFHNADIGAEVITLMGINHKRVFGPFVETILDCLDDAQVHVNL
jgi:hypothetical protein